MRLKSPDQTLEKHMRHALALARRGLGATSPNPMVGAVLVKNGRVIGKGWHRRAGKPHAEIEAISNARAHRANPEGATLYVTLEPCCTHGRTPPCTEAIISARIGRVVVGTTDPNPLHHGRGLRLLRRAGVDVHAGILEAECAALNSAFNHWIIHRTPLVTVKAAMTLDGKIATASGQSKWVTGKAARGYGMKLRKQADAILVGINTILADDPSLTLRGGSGRVDEDKLLRRIVLDSSARTPLNSRVVSDARASLTTIFVSPAAPRTRVKALSKRVRVVAAPLVQKARSSSGPARLDLSWVLKRLGSEDITSLLVEGGGEVNASFLAGGLAHQVKFFYAPKIVGGRDARTAVAGTGATRMRESIPLTNVHWRRIGRDWLLEAEVSRNLRPRKRRP